jgi:hypothetical protein
MGSAATLVAGAFFAILAQSPAVPAGPFTPVPPSAQPATEAPKLRADFRPQPADPHRLAQPPATEDCRPAATPEPWASAFQPKPAPAPRASTFNFPSLRSHRPAPKAAPCDCSKGAGGCPAPLHPHHPRARTSTSAR